MYICVCVPVSVCMSVCVCVCVVFVGFILRVEEGSEVVMGKGVTPKPTSNIKPSANSRPHTQM